MRTDADPALALALASLSSSREPSQAPRLERAIVDAVGDDGLLLTRLACGHSLWCEVLLTAAIRRESFVPGTNVLVLLSDQSINGVCLGPVGRLDTPRTLEVAAAESLTLRCGESSIDLRADGKVVIKGEDVLVRAKGTKRIRAGSVSIN